MKGKFKDLTLGQIKRFCKKQRCESPCKHENETKDGLRVCDIYAAIEGKNINAKCFGEEGR